MTRYTLMLFQMAYHEQIKIEKSKVKDGIYIECWLLNEDKEPHMLLFDGTEFTKEMNNIWRFVKQEIKDNESTKSSKATKVVSQACHV